LLRIYFIILINRFLIKKKIDQLKNELKKFSEKIGFTETEIKVILFLIVIFFIGFGYKYFFIDKNIAVYKEFDYTKQDSLFYAAIKRDSLEKLNNINTVDNIDYKQKVSDFNKSKVVQENKISNKFDINRVDVKSLITLPGIGEATAENIIKYRTENKGIKSLSELLKIKGIGNLKFNKIKKYLYIEK